MKKKGFTLIELLAVIVVLAVIALIAVPVILGVVDKAKVGAAKASALNYIDAVEKYIAISQIDETKIKLSSGTYNVSKETEVSLIDYIIPKVYAEENSEIYLNDIISVKGDKPTKGTVTIENNKVEDYALEIKGYTVKNGDISEKPVDGEVAITGEPISDYTQDLLDNNTTYGNYTYMGGTYLKGVQNNNYVWYNGFMWRIMGKNSDGTARLITEEDVTAIPWGATNTGLSPAYSIKEKYINDWLNDYFYSHLNNTKNIIEDSTWCINTTTSGTSARTNCTGGNTFNSKVGLISVDEYNLSGASQTNNNYYLVNGQYFWTLTPYSTSYAWFVKYNGITNGITCNYDVISSYGTRPVINVKADATITTGDGTATNPYMLEQARTNVTNKTLNEKATSGEYVKLSDKIYRVVSKEEQGIKLILDGYYESDSTFGTNNTFAGSTIDTLLNGKVLTWLNSDKIIDATWNQGGAFDYGNPYTKSLPNTENSEKNITRKVGLIRIGEMLASQSSTMLTKNYTVASSYSNTKYYWTMTPHTSVSRAWYVYHYGTSNNGDLTGSYGVRPVIYVGTNTTITGGNGTPSSPYEI